MAVNFDRVAFGAVAGFGAAQFRRPGGGRRRRQERAQLRQLEGRLTSSNGPGTRWCSTHHLNCWYQAHLFVGRVCEGRAGVSGGAGGGISAGIPSCRTSTPRGCQKGGCFSERIRPDPDHPPAAPRRPQRLGKWGARHRKEALDDIADKYLDVTVNDGTDRTIWDLGPGVDLGSGVAAQMRFSSPDPIGRSRHEQRNRRLRRGTVEMFGKIVFERSADDYFNSDLILFWAGNPVYTQIPKAHFYTSATYHGTKIISILHGLQSVGDQVRPVDSDQAGHRCGTGLAVCHLKSSPKTRSTSPSSRNRPTCRCWCAAIRGPSSSRRTCRLTAVPDHHDAVGREEQQPEDGTYKTLALGPRSGAGGETHGETEGRRGSRGSQRVFAAERTTLLITRRECLGNLRRHAEDDPPADPRKPLPRRMSRLPRPSMQVLHGNLAERSKRGTGVLPSPATWGARAPGFAGFPLINADGGDKFALPPTHEEAQPFGALPAADRKAHGRRRHREMIVTDLGRHVLHSGNGLLRTPIWTSGTLFWSIHGAWRTVARKESAWNLGPSGRWTAYAGMNRWKRWQPLSPPAGSDRGS